MVHPAIEVRVVDPDTGAVLDPGAEGELEFRGPNVVDAYLGEPDRPSGDSPPTAGSAAAIWATLVGEGVFTYICRMGDALRLRGFLVDPAEIEVRLAAHPAVHTAKVVGVPDPTAPRWRSGSSCPTARHRTRTHCAVVRRRAGRVQGAADRARDRRDADDDRHERHQDPGGGAARVGRRPLTARNRLLRTSGHARVTTIRAGGRCRAARLVGSRLGSVSPADDTDPLAAALAAAGLGDVRPGETLPPAPSIEVVDPEPEKPAAPTELWPEGAGTGVGSLPGIDPAEAAAVVTGETPDLPALPNCPPAASART